MKYKNTGTDRVFNIVNGIILAFIFIVVAYPLIYVVSASLSSPTAIIQGRVKLLPVDFSLGGYKAVFANGAVVTGFLNSMFYMIVGTCVNVMMTVMLAYPLSRKGFYGGKAITLLLIFTMMFNAGLIPNYLLIDSLNLIDKRAVMIIPKALNVWNVMITITYFRTTIPDELLEASQVDGCTDFNFIGKIVLPLSKPILAVISLFYAVQHWNSFFDAMLYLNSEKLVPLQIVLRDILVQNQLSMDMITSLDPESISVRENLAVLLKYALIVVSSLPLLIMYPFIQKYFVKGIMIGSVKG